MALRIRKSGSLGSSSAPLFVIEIPYQQADVESQLSVGLVDVALWSGPTLANERGYLFVRNVSTAGQRIRVFKADTAGGIELLPGEGMVIGDSGVSLTYRAIASAAGGLLDRFCLVS